MENMITENNIVKNENFNINKTDAVGDIIDEKTGTVLFKKEELRCKKTGEGRLAKGFEKELLKLRLIFGKPISINSCCRSFLHNKEVGGRIRSFHVYDNMINGVDGTCAIDVQRSNGIYTGELIKTALNLGWSAGIAKTFLHLDRRSDYLDLPQIIFTY